MYRFQTCDINGEETRVVYCHPTFTDYGLALSINRAGEQHVVECNIVTGSIDGHSRLEIITDHSAPLDVQLWCFTGMRTIRESVNTDSLELSELFPNNSGIFYYSKPEESKS